MVPRLRDGQTGDAEMLILKAVEQKRHKGGAAYASGKSLIVFLNAGAGVWFPNRVARQLPEPLHFDAVWVMGLQRVEAGEYVYGVTALDLSEGNAPTWLVQIGKDFNSWEVAANLVVIFMLDITPGPKHQKHRCRNQVCAKASSKE